MKSNIEYVGIGTLKAALDALIADKGTGTDLHTHCCKAVQPLRLGEKLNPAEAAGALSDNSNWVNVAKLMGTDCEGDSQSTIRAPA
jgi:hypothetical protein